MRYGVPTRHRPKREYGKSTNCYYSRCSPAPTSMGAALRTKRLAVRTRPKWRRIRREMDLSIIIVNWNSARHVRNCLRSILAHTSDLEYEIIVIDAGSFDGCSEMLGREFPQV